MVVTTRQPEYGRDRRTSVLVYGTVSLLAVGEFRGRSYKGGVLVIGK